MTIDNNGFRTFRIVRPRPLRISKTGFGRRIASAKAQSKALPVYEGLPHLRSTVHKLRLRLRAADPAKLVRMVGLLLLPVA